LLVFKLKDHSGAERYCQQPSGDDEYEKRLARRDLYFILLSVYLKPNKGFAFHLHCDSLVPSS